jgi:hypothetical protein
MACFRLVTFLPDLPLFSVPRLRSCIAFSTFCEALFPYLAMNYLLTDDTRSSIQWMRHSCQRA